MNDTPYLTLTGKLWGVFHELYQGKWLQFIESAPYHSLLQMLLLKCLLFNPVMLHDNIITWKHFAGYWPFMQGIHWPPVNSPHKGQWHGALVLSLISPWINAWVNNCEAGNLRCYHAHYDVTVMGFGSPLVFHYRNAFEDVFWKTADIFAGGNINRHNLVTFVLELFKMRQNNSENRFNHSESTHL